jgi:LacI family transcriptional regulator
MAIIGISLHFQDSYDKEVTRGIIEGAKEHIGWRLSGPIGGLNDVFDRREHQLDALITRIENPEAAKRYSKLHIPIIDVAGAYQFEGIYRVQNDDIATGKKAGDCMRDLGVLSFAYCGVKNTHWSALRLKGFSQSIATDLQYIATFNRSLLFYKNPQQSKELINFLSNLTIPTAIFCCNDIVAIKVTRHLLDMGYQIPNQISVVSVDNDPLLCSLATPSLTSVALDCFSIGYKAVSVVSKLLEGNMQSIDKELLIPPLDVVERESTQIFSTHDSVVYHALMFIKEHVCEGINVQDVARMSATSRRNLELKWKKTRGRTILAEIIDHRLKVAKRLLRETDSTIESIAIESGFNSSQRFYAMFKREQGCSPTQWRIMSKNSYR